MREIKFRGKRVDNGEWVYGSFLEKYHSTRFGIIDAIFYSDENGTHRIPIIPETVGQYTGLKDKNDVDVYEGDVVDFLDMPGGDYELCTGKVIFEEFGWHFTNSITESSLECYESEYVTVIGNVHNNPELLKGGN